MPAQQERRGDSRAHVVNGVMCGVFHCPVFSKGAVDQTICHLAWLSTHIALLPLAEQHRIVANANEFMSACDELEARLTATTTARTRLLDSLLAEAVAPAAARRQDVAE